MSRIIAGSITAHPNPVEIHDGSGVGITTLLWKSEGTEAVEVHIHAPDGPLFSRSGPSGRAVTGKWVSDGMVFYLQDVSKELPLTFENTLASITVSVKISGMEFTDTAYNPDVYPFAAYLGQRFGCKYIISIGCSNPERIAELYPQFEVIGIDSGKDLEVCRNRYGFGTWMEWNFDQPGCIPLEKDVLAHAIIVCDSITERFKEPSFLFKGLKGWLDYAPICVLTAYGEDSSDLGRVLRSQGLNPLFTGSTVSDNRSYQKRTVVAIIEKNASAKDSPDMTITAKAPSDFRVVAIMTAYNEEDIIVPSIEHLIAQGVEVYLIDNWSTDATYELAKQFIGKGLIGIERFPREEPPQFYNWKDLLKRVEKIAGEIKADWFIHHDADEVRVSPWQGVTLKDAIYMVDQKGFNCIDHTVIEFHPVDNGFMPGTDFEAYFKYFEFSKHFSDFVRINAWKNSGLDISLAATGGHDVCFEGRRVYPYKFLLKHYRIRSQAHGEKKVFTERKPRWNPDERARGWHMHYDNMQRGHVFSRSPSELELFDEVHFNRLYLIERLSGVGMLRQEGLALTTGAQTENAAMVSIIILNYNLRDDLETCLLSLLNLEFPREKMEIIVIDNGSSDGSQKMVSQKFPDIRLIRNETNLGFTKAANLGSFEAKGEYLAFLNNDIRVDKNWLKFLFQAVRPEDGVVCVGSRIMNWDGTAIDFMGRPDDTFCLAFEPHVLPLPPHEYTLFASGGALMIQRKVFHEVGGFDPDFFMYHEDVDLGWRLWIHGYKCITCSEAVVYHRGGATSGRLPSEFIQFLSQRNMLTSIYKNMQEDVLREVLPLLMYYLLERSRWCPQCQQSLPAAMKEFLDSLESLLSKRNAVQKKRTRSDHDIFSLVGHPFNFFLNRESYKLLRPQLLELWRDLDFDPNNADTARSAITGWSNAAHFLHERHLVTEIKAKEQELVILTEQLRVREQNIERMKCSKNIMNGLLKRATTFIKRIKNRT
jgi:GT2 family glycosyltransferase